MAFTDNEEATLKKVAAAFERGKTIASLGEANPADENLTAEVVDSSGETKKVKLVNVIKQRSVNYCGRYWDATLSTPTASGIVGNIDMLRETPNLLGLGGYTVTDDRTRRKLDPTNHYKHEDGSTARLDGSHGQYMFGWNGFYAASWKEGNNIIEAWSDEPFKDRECQFIPAGGTSALGAGVVDRTNLLLCSVINDDPQYRGGTNSSTFGDDQYKSLCGRAATNIAANTFSAYARKRGEGWEANWFVSRFVQEFLFRVIMGTRNSRATVATGKDSNSLYQGGLGNGVTTLSSAEWLEWSEHASTYQPVIPTSVGVELGDGVGEVAYNLLNRDGSVFKTVQVPVFFGLKNMFGNLWQMVRGMICDIQNEDSYAYIAPSLYAGQSDTSVAEMLQAGRFPDIGTLSSYVKTRSMYRLAGVPTELGGSATTYDCSYLWRSTLGLRSRLAGGSAHSGAQAGAGAFHAHNAVTSASSNVSAPLCYFEQDPIIV